MNRRELIALLGGAASLPVAARAQTMPVIGYLDIGSPEQGAYLLAAFRKGLSETGYVEGQNVAIEYRWARNELDRLPGLAAELVSRRVAVIATPASGLTTNAAKAATTTIPIVFSIGRDPVQLGLVASLSRPGSNLTGYSDMNTEVGAKKLGLLYALLPSAARFGVLTDTTNPAQQFQLRELQAAAVAIGRPIEILGASTESEIDTAFETVVQRRIDALLVNASALFFPLRTHIIELAARYAVPTIYWDRMFPEAGGLMSYGAGVADSVRKVGVYVGKILKGEKPADLPVQQATKIELVINLKTAKALGVTVPPSLLATADEVIE